MKTRLLTTPIAVFLALTSWANGMKINGIYYLLDNSTKTACVTNTGNKYNGDLETLNPISTAYKGSITIPNSVSHYGTTYSVTSIGEKAFRGCKGLTSITIPNSVTSIGERAFSHCTSLTSINIPSSVTSIGEGAFGGCTGLTSIEVETGNTKYDSRDNCNAIIETVSNTLVVGCKATSIPSSVTIIGEDAFENCTSLTNINIPNSVTSIGEGAFWGCKGLSSITIPSSVTSIESGAFVDCTSLTSINIPNSVTSIGNWAFDGCTGLTSVSIPESVTSIGYQAFAGCTGLTSITIPNSVTSIGDIAFQSCTSLTSITIPNSVSSIGGLAFYGCTGLTDVTVQYADPIECSCNSDAFNNSSHATATLHVPAGCKTAYENCAPWSNFSSIIDDAKAK